VDKVVEAVELDHQVLQDQIMDSQEQLILAEGVVDQNGKVVQLLVEQVVQES
tara:strand:+ start:337 stop:492 length:156 start_codon:yes stop_codon:yes gene_type:complete